MQMFYPQIILEDVGYFYDLDTFNRCEDGCLLPVDWSYQMPYGLLCQKIPQNKLRNA